MLIVPLGHRSDEYQRALASTGNGKVNIMTSMMTSIESLINKTRVCSSVWLSDVALLRRVRQLDVAGVAGVRVHRVFVELVQQLVLGAGAVLGVLDDEAGHV